MAKVWPKSLGREAESPGRSHAVIDELAVRRTIEPVFHDCEVRLELLEHATKVAEADYCDTQTIDGPRTPASNGRQSSIGSNG